MLLFVKFRVLSIIANRILSLWLTTCARTCTTTCVRTCETTCDIPYDTPDNTTCAKTCDTTCDSTCDTTYDTMTCSELVEAVATMENVQDAQRDRGAVSAGRERSRSRSPMVETGE